MGKTIEEVSVIKRAFSKEYFSKAPYNTYMNMCGISTLGMVKRLNQPNLTLKDGESLEDLCISAGFKSQPPKELTFPDEYQGVRVFYRVIGIPQAF